MATDVPEPEDNRSEAQLRLELELEAIAAAQADGLFFTFHDDFGPDYAPNMGVQAGSSFQSRALQPREGRS
ncbi:hypothetical protein [Flindersiella endophytica]